MAEKKGRTFVEAKKARGINELAREGSKTFKEYRKRIHKSIESEPKSIPQIACETGLPLNIVTYHLMTCRKYGSIEVEGIDDKDEYFLYRLKNTGSDGNED